DCKPRLPNRPPLPRPNHLYSEKVLFYHALNLLGLQPGTTPAPPTPTKAYNLIKPCQACSLTPSSLPLVNTSLNLSLSDPLSQCRGRFLIFSIRAVARSPLHRACSLILDTATRFRCRHYTRVHHFIVFASLFFFFTSDSDLYPSPSTSAYSFK
ncbi:hypothetical protein S83_027886, partial [Arachis hypogaea]